MSVSFKTIISEGLQPQRLIVPTRPDFIRQDGKPQTQTAGEMVPSDPPNKPKPFAECLKCREIIEYEPTRTYRELDLTCPKCGNKSFKLSNGGIISRNNIKQENISMGIKFNELIKEAKALVDDKKNDVFTTKALKINSLLKGLKTGNYKSIQPMFARDFAPDFEMLFTAFMNGELNSNLWRQKIGGPLNLLVGPESPYKTQIMTLADNKARPKDMAVMYYALYVLSDIITDKLTTIDEKDPKYKVIDKYLKDVNASISLLGGDLSDPKNKKLKGLGISLVRTDKKTKDDLKGGRVRELSSDKVASRNANIASRKAGL